MTSGLHALDPRGARDEQLVVVVVDAEERSRHGYRREWRRAVDLDHDEPTLGQRIEELRPRDQRERRGAGRERAGARIRERHRLPLTARQLVDVEGRSVGARDEEPVRRLRPRDRAAHSATRQLTRLLAGRRIDDAHVAARIENVELGPVLVRRHRRDPELRRERRDGEVGVDREPRFRSRRPRDSRT